jgi:hypothetical protein
MSFVGNYYLLPPNDNLQCLVETRAILKYTLRATDLELS